ncbi:hypothetical protein INR49_028562 [Caranx melampygus]|nr:hypothetical protein INR49_028562 [Caranx melampygus]
MQHSSWKPVRERADTLLQRFQVWLIRNAGLLTLKTEMDSTKMWFFLFTGFGLTTCSDTNFREYHFVNQSLNWTEAQNYCREKYTDLATFESVEDLNRLNRPSGDTHWSWIGLNDDPKSWWRVMSNDSNSWRWSATGKTSETGYQSWYPGEPTNRLEHVVCVFINYQGQWLDDGCKKKTYFLCFNESDPPGHRVYTLINRSLTWTEAQTYCRTHHTDLATIENAEENAEAVSVMTTNSVSEAWIGFYRVRWRWSDNSNSSFTNWNSGQPDGTDKFCVLEDSTHTWHDISCDEKHFFWCYKDLRVKKTMVRMKIQTFADLSDPATNAQILQQLSERFSTLHGDVKLRWVTQPTKQEEDDDEDNGKCN